MANCLARTKSHVEINDLASALGQARHSFQQGDFRTAFDLYEELYVLAPQYAVQLLSEAFQLLKRIPNQDRYTLYQSRYFDFEFLPSDKVLDIGSGHLPFPFATHLGEYAIEDDSYGCAGIPFKYVEGKPVIQCNVEKMPFSDKEFDFVYCSHVLEHVDSPELACKELMRVGKKGYIETPTRACDLLFNAKISNHKWSVELINGVLVFRKYTPIEVEGLQSLLLLDMNCNPKTEREQAFSALFSLKADRMNTMLCWDDSFHFEVCSGS